MWLTLLQHRMILSSITSVVEVAVEEAIEAVVVADLSQRVNCAISMDMTLSIVGTDLMQIL